MGDHRTMEEEEEEFSILKKSVIPNLLQDDFSSYNESTFLTEVDEDEAPSDLQQEEEAGIEVPVQDQHDKQKFFQKDVDFRQTLINEDSFENINVTDHTLDPEQYIQDSKLQFPILDIFASLGLVLVVIELFVLIM